MLEITFLSLSLSLRKNCVDLVIPDPLYEVIESIRRESQESARGFKDKKEEAWSVDK